MNLSIHSTKARLGSREGFALPAVIFALFVMSSVAVAGLLTSTDERRSSMAVRQSFDAFYAAEAGLDAIVAEWKGQLYDTLMPSTGDSVIIASRTLQGGCSYTALIHRVDNGVGRTFAVTTQGRGSGGFSGSRTLNMLLEPEIQLPMGGVMVGGNLLLNGNAEFSGPCGDVHANGPIQVGGDLETTGISSSGTVTVGGTIVDSLGNTLAPETGVPEMTFPDLDPMDFCGTADFILRNDGTITNVELNQTKNNTGWGWKYDSGADLWEADNAAQITGGTLCVEGNFKIGIDLGTKNDPIEMSIFSGGSVMVNGDPYMTPAPGQEGVGIMAAGDLKLNGNPSAGAKPNYTGLYYAGSQCLLNGTPALTGQLMCLDKPNPPGSLPLVVDSKINGDATLKFDCTAAAVMVPGEIKRLGRRSFGSPVY